jgi:hypothetical protein
MPLREVHDDDGVLWLIYQVRPTATRKGVPQVQPGLAGGWLCFQSPQGKRRLAGVPDSWEMMEAVELLALMKKAELATASRRASPAEATPRLKPVIKALEAERDHGATAE